MSEERQEQGLTKGDYEFAIHSQCACNLSGISHTFSDVMRKIWVEARKLNEGTDWVNTHPIAVLYATQIAHLSECGNFDNYHTAHEACEKAFKELKGKKEEVEHVH